MIDNVRWRDYIEEWDKEPAKAAQWMFSMLLKCGIKASDPVTWQEYKDGCLIIMGEDFARKYDTSLLVERKKE